MKKSDTQFSSSQAALEAALGLEALEPRILLDAAALATGVEAVDAVEADTIGLSVRGLFAGEAGDSAVPLALTPLHVSETRDELDADALRALTEPQSVLGSLANAPAKAYAEGLSVPVGKDGTAPDKAGPVMPSSPLTRTVDGTLDVTIPAFDREAGLYRADAADPDGRSLDMDAFLTALRETSPGALYVIDAAVDGYQALLDAVPEGADVLVIQPDENGVSVLAQALIGRGGADAVHILSHGDAGAFTLGTATVDAGTIAVEHAADLAAIRSALAASGDILIYGCDFGADADAMRALAAATGADIAASTDDTGAAALGGNWVLEAATGTIEARALAAPAFSTLLAGGAPTLDLDSVDGGLDNAETVVRGQASGTLIAPLATITDAEGDEVQSIEIAVGGIADGAAETLRVGTVSVALHADATPFTTTIPGTATDVVVTYQSGTLVIEGINAAVITRADAQTLIRSLSYANSNANATLGDRTFDIRVEEENGATTSITFEQFTAGTNPGAAAIGSDAWWGDANFNNGLISSVTNDPGFVVAQQADGNFLQHFTDGPVPTGQDTVFGRAGIPVEAGQTYQISVDLAALNAAGNLGPFDLVIIENGVPTILRTITSAELPSQTWTTFTANHVVSAGVTALDFEIRNASTSQVGNDFAIDNIVFEPLNKVFSNGGTNTGTPGTPARATVSITAGVDTDGDGVFDADDVDDDNDGILDVDEAGEPFVFDLSTITIGNGFTEATGNTPLWLANSPVFLTGSPGDPRIALGNFPITDFETGSSNSGEVFAINAGGATVQNEELEVITFDADGLAPNAQYELSFAHVIWGRSNSPVSQRGELYVDVNGIRIATLQGDPALTFGEWTQDSFMVTSDANGQINVSFSVARGLGLDGHDYLFDAINLTPAAGVLTPRDTDGDGINDWLDLDSDNDGIPDNIEAQRTVGYVAPNADSAATFTANNGLNSAYVGTNGLSPVDTDSDGTDDVLDTDSDDEGGSDAAESGIGGAAVATGLSDASTDADGDGLFDVFENGSANDGYVINDGLTPASFADTDGDAILDQPLTADLDFRDGRDDTVAGFDPQPNGDNDGDGIINADDIDDDNDGILDVDEGLTFGAPPASLLDGSEFDRTDLDDTNGAHSIRTDNLGNEYSIFGGGGSGVDFVGWTETGTVDWSTGAVIFSGSPVSRADPSDPNAQTLLTDGIFIQESNVSGGAFATFSRFGESISQTVQVEAGKTYTVSFEVGLLPTYSDTSTTRFNPDIDFGIRDPNNTGALLALSEADHDASGFTIGTDFPDPATLRPADRDNPIFLDPQWQFFTHTFTATTTGDVEIFFQANNVDAIVTVDSVRFVEGTDVVATLGRDTDGDGIQDHLDLDSDNDGISDLHEAGHGGVDANRDGIIDDVRSSTSGGDANNDGLSDSVAGFTAIRDTDMDGTDDYLDLDSDNDGIADTIEGRATNPIPFGFQTNDGDVTDDDADQDGVVFIGGGGASEHDQINTFGGTFSPVENTDGDALEDYRDPDSDNDGIFDRDESGLAVVTDATYADPDGSAVGVGNLPVDVLSNTFGDANEVDFRSVNTPPVVDLDDDTTSPTRDVTRAYASGAGDVQVIAANGGVFDVDSAEIRDITINFTPSQWLDGTDEVLTIGGVEITPSAVSNSTSETITVNGNDYVIAFLSNGTQIDSLVIGQVGGGLTPLADAQTILQSITYRNAAATPMLGDRSFTVQAQADQLGVADSNVATATITLSNTAPMAVDDGPVDVAAGGAVIIDVLGNDSDPETDPISVTEIIDPAAPGTPIALVVDTPVTLASGTTVTLQADGTLRVVTESADAGAETFGYTLSDGSLTDDATVTLNVAANMQPAFACDNTLYQTYGSSFTAPTQLASVDPATGLFTDIGDTSHGLTVNGTAINSNDGFMYGMRILPTASNELVRIGSDGSFVNLGAVDGLPPAFYVAGSMGPGGLYFVSDSNSETYYGINLETLQVEQTVVIPGGANMFDFAFTPAGIGYGYVWDAVAGTSQLISADPATNTITTIGAPVPVFFGAMYADAAGRVFASANDGSGLFEMDLTTGAITRVGDSPVAGANDGALCNLAFFDAPPVLDLDSAAFDAAEPGVDVAATFTEGDTPLAIVQPDADLFDAGEDDLVSLVITAGGFADGASEQLVIGGTIVDAAGSTTFTSGTLSVTVNAGVITLANAADPAQAFDTAEAEALLRGITYENTSDAPTAGDRTLAMVLTDAGGQSASATATITVAPVNDDPIAVDDTGSATQNGVFFDEVRLNDSDPDGDPVTITLINGQPVQPFQTFAGDNGGVFEIDDQGVYGFDTNGEFDDLAPGETRTTSFTYTVSDGNGGTDTATVTITVNGANDDPIATDNARTIAADDSDPLNGNLITADEGSGVDSDVDGDTLRVTDVGGVGNALPINSTAGSYGTLVWSADGNYNYLLDTANADVAALRPGQTLTDTLIYTVSDGAGGTDTAELTITIGGVNDTPVNIQPVADQSGTDAAPISPLDVSAAFSDPDGDTLSYSAAGLPPGLSIDPATGIITGTPDNSNSVNGPFTVTVTAEDPSGETATVSFDWTFTNPAPVVDTPIGAQTAEDGDAVTFTPDISDVDGDDLAYSVSGLPAGLSIDPATGVISGTIDNSASQVNGGVYMITVTADDGEGGTATDTFTLTVTNPGPDAVDDFGTTTQNGIFLDEVRLNDSDPDGDDLSLATINGQPVQPFQVVAGSNGGVFEIDSAGVYAFDTNGEFDGLDEGETTTTSFTYTVTDGEGGTDTATVTITIVGTNDAPVIVAALPPEAAEDGDAVAIDTAGGFSDPDVEALSFTATGLPAGLSIDPVTGRITGTLVADASQNGPASDGVYSVTVTASDMDGESVSQVFQITVTNPAPDAVDDTINTAEDTPVEVPVIGNDADPDGDALSVLSVTQPANGSVVIDPVTGNPVYTPDADFNGEDSFTYTLSDGEGGTDTATVTVRVGPVNDAPVALDDAVATPEDTPVTIPVRGNDTDVDGDALTVTAVTQGANGSVTIDPVTGDPVYTPDPNFNGTDTFTYTVDDGFGGTATATVTVSVDAVNDAPRSATAPRPLTGTDSVPLTPVPAGDLFDDIDGDPLRFTSPDLPVWMSLDPDTGELTGTPPADASVSGPYAVTIVATDPDGQSASTVITFDIANPAPVIVAPTADVALEDAQVVSIPTDITDPDGDRLLYTATNLPPGLSILSTTGEIVGTLDNSASQGGPDGDGVYVVTVTADDGEGGTVSEDIVITVTNPGPDAVDDTFTANEGTTITANVVLGSDTDPDQDTLTVTPVVNQTGSAGGTFDVTADGTMTFDAGTDFDGLDEGEMAVTSVTYTISDGEGGTDMATIFVTVTGTNDAPVATGPIAAQSGTDSQPLAPLDVSGNFDDVDGEPLAFTLTGQPAWMSIDPATGIITGTPPADASVGGVNADGVYAVTVTATDPDGESVSQQVLFTIGNTDVVAADDSFTIAEEGSVSGDLIAANDLDADGDVLTIDALALPDGSALPIGSDVDVPEGVLRVNADGTFRFDAAPDFNGTLVFGYTVTDGEGSTDVATVTIVVTPEPDAPRVIDPRTGEPADDPEAILPGVVSTDGVPMTDVPTAQVFAEPDGDPLVFTLGPDAPDWLSIDPDTGVVSGTPPSDASTGGPVGDGRYPVTVTATDPDGQSVSTVLNVTVVNTVPNAVPDGVVTTPEDTPVTIDVIGNDTDTDGDTLFVSAVEGQPVTAGSSVPVEGGTVTLNADGTLTFTPDADVSGLPRFTYTVSDGEGGTDEATVTLSVTSVPDAPVLDLSVAVETDHDDPAIRPVAPGSFVSDVDSPEMSAVTLTLGGPDDGTGERLTIGGVDVTQPVTTTLTVGGVDYNVVGDGRTVTIRPTGITAPIADIDALLATIAYVHEADAVTLGDRTVSVSVTDETGLSSNAGDIVITLNPDVTAPEVPDITTVATDPNANVVVTGTGEPGATVTVTFPDGSTVETLVDDDGNWTAVSEGEQPDGDIIAVQTDPSGNVSEPDTAAYVNDVVDRPIFTDRADSQTGRSQLGDFSGADPLRDRVGDERYTHRVFGPLGAFDPTGGDRLERERTFMGGTSMIPVPGTDDTEHVWVEAVARDYAIDIELASTTTGERTVRSWSVTQPNGAPLPAGVELMGDYVVVERPLATDQLALRVRALLENGQTVTQTVVIDLRTATVTPDGDMVIASQTLHEQMAELIRQADRADRPLLDAAE